MWRNLFVVLSVLLLPLMRASEEVLSNPGKVFLWSYGGNDALNSHEYITKSMNVQQAMSSLKEVAGNYELVVILHPKEEAELKFLTKEAVANGKEVKVLNYVYPTQGQDHLQHSLQAAFNSPKVPLNRLSATLEAQQGLLTNQVPDYVQVVGHDHEMANVYQNTISKMLSEEIKSKVLFVSYVEIAPSTIAAPSTSRRLLGDYSRILATTITYSTPGTEGKFYKPEGTEYSIYYADTYLYITPDIFTGIMTGLFIFFTVLIGMTCLSQIQGMSTFYDKLPVVGKEA